MSKIEDNDNIIEENEIVEDVHNEDTLDAESVEEASADGVDSNYAPMTLKQKRTKEKKKQKNIKGLIAVVSIIVLALIGVGTYFGITNHNKEVAAQKAEANKVVVPTADTLIEYNEDADSACVPFTKAGLTCTITWTYNDSKAKGTLLQQSITANTKVDKKTKVVLTYSNGKENVTVPNLNGKTLEEAKQELYNNNITIKEVKETTSNGLEEGIVISTDIQPGTALKSADKPSVVVNVSNGKVTVPDWSGKTREYVEADAEKLGIKVSFKEEESDQASGIVISQTPQAGETSATETVNVTISKTFESKDLVIPDVIGKTPEEAQSILASTGFRQINTATVQTSAVTSKQVTQVVPGVGQTGKSEENIVLIVSEPVTQ